MRPIRDWSIHAKLTLILMITVSLAVLLAAVALVFHDFGIVRSAISRHVTSLAAVLGPDCAAALRDGDSATAQEILSRLREEPLIDFACLYDAQDQPFAVYRAGQESTEALPSSFEEGCSSAGSNYLQVCRRIPHEGTPVGRIYLHADMTELRSKFLQYVVIIGLVLTVSLIISLLVGSRLQRLISRPLLALAQATQTISSAGDYSVRVRLRNSK